MPVPKYLCHAVKMTIVASLERHLIFLDHELQWQTIMKTVISETLQARDHILNGNVIMNSKKMLRAYFEQGKGVKW